MNKILWMMAVVVLALMSIDARAQGITAVDTTTALNGLSGTTPQVVIKTGNRVAGDMPAVTYYWMGSGVTCDVGGGDGDGGSEIPYVVGTINTGCWHIAPQSGWDPRWWGAYADVVAINRTIATTATLPKVTITGAPCTAAYIGATITFTHIKSSTGASAADPSYHGVILSCSGATFNLDNPVPFTTTVASGIAQYIRYGHLDDDPLTKWATFLGTVKTGNIDYVPGNFGGASYGVSGPINLSAGANYFNGSLTLLSNAGCSATNGVLNVSAANTTVNSVYVDLSFLACNGYYLTTNGVTIANQLEIRHWYGSIGSPITPTVSGATGGYTLTIASASTGLSQMMVSHGSVGIGIQDRSFILKVDTTTIAGSTILTMSRPLTSSISSQTASFYNDSNGLVVSGTNAGMHGVLITASQFDAPSNDPGHTNSGDNFGCSLLYGGTQTDFYHFTSDGSAATICIGNTANAGIDFIEPHIFNTNYNTTENDPPAILVADAASPKIVLDHPHMTGALQYFLLSSNLVTLDISHLTTAVAPNVTLTNNAVVQIIAAPSIAADTSYLALDPYPLNPSGLIPYHLGGFPSCGSGSTKYSYASFSCDQLTTINTLNGGVMIPTRNPLATPGANLLSAGLTNDGPLCTGPGVSIVSGFGTTGANIPADNGSCAFEIIIGSNGTDTNGVVQFPTAATTAWACAATDLTTRTTTVFRTAQTAFTVQRATLTNFNSSNVAAAWAAGDRITVSCHGI